MGVRAALCVGLLQWITLTTAVKYDMHVGLLRAAPDCFPKTVIVANQQWQYPIEVVQGDTLEVTVYNDIPPNYPMTMNGISIHWHGLSLKGEPGAGEENNAQWYDGVSYLTQCPIPPGGNMTYSFVVTDTPGSYWWHGHAGVEAIDGLYGPLIIYPNGEEPLQYDDEIIMMVGDWFHDQAAAMAMRLNRPFDKNVTAADPDRGGWVWTDLPQAMHFNGYGYYGDCKLYAAPSGSPQPTTCAPEHFSVPKGRSAIQPWAAFDNPGCSHWNTTVEQGKTYRVRITNVASLGYVTVVFGGHNVTLVAADGVPIEPKSVSQVDLNNGMRYDVLLKADQPVDNYWLFVQMQYRVGSPGGYAVLRYKGANETALPTSDPPQPDTFKPWDVETTNANLKGYRQFYDTPDGPANASAIKAFGIELPGNLTNLTPPPATRTIVLNLTQPLLEKTGQLRWSLNNIAHMENPSCDAVLDELYANGGATGWAQKRAAETLRGNGIQAYNLQEGHFTDVAVYIEGQQTYIESPRAAHHIVEIEHGDVIDIVVQNLKANANDGDYRGTPEAANRTAYEEHPFHLHGHKFWVLARDIGTWNESSKEQYNTVDPVFRDSYTLFKQGWSAIRFVADNPGAWAFHCHVLWHHYMGQRLVISESIDRVSERPDGFPACPESCTFSNAPFRKSFVKEKWGDTGYALP